MKHHRVLHVLRYDDFGGFSSSATEERLFEAVGTAEYKLVVGVVPFYVDVAKMTSTMSADIRPLEVSKVELLRSFLKTGSLEVALHGYAHLATAPSRGLAEFSDGVPEDVQRQLLRRGRDELEDRFQRAVSIFVPPWNVLGAITARVVAELGMRVLGADASLPAAVASGVGCVPCDAAISETMQILKSASRHPDSIVGTTLHDYDFAESGFLSGRSISDLLTLMNEWRELASPSDLAESECEAFAPARVSDNLSFRTVVLSRRLPGRLTQTSRQIFWSQKRAAALTRIARFAP